MQLQTASARRGSEIRAERWKRALPGLALTLLGAAPAFGQATVYGSSLGTGDFDAGGESVAGLQIPLSFQLRDMEEDQWGVRLRIPVTLGFTRFEDGTTQGLEDLQTLSALATAEFELPLEATWTLIPFVGLGAAHEFSSSQTQWLGNGGVKLRSDHGWNAHHLTFATALRYGFELGSNGVGFEDFGRTELGVDLFTSLGANVGGKHLTPGVYSRAFLYWNELVFDTPEGQVAVDSEYEVGLSLGTAPSIQVFGLDLPRVFLGYRFGEGLEGVRITFGDLL